MKRNLLIILIFCLIASVLFLSNCTLYWEDGSTCRGFGYECGIVCGEQKGCGASFMDCLCPGEDYYQDHKDSVSLFAREGVDYTCPTVEVAKTESGYTYYLSFDILTEYPEPWEAYIELCFMQSGVLVGEARWDGNDMESGEIRLYTGALEHKPGEILDRQKRTVIWTRDANRDKQTQYEIRHFARCILDDTMPLTNGRAALQSLRVIWELYNAEHNGYMAKLEGLGIPEEYQVEYYSCDED